MVKVLERTGLILARVWVWSRKYAGSWSRSGRKQGEDKEKEKKERNNFRFGKDWENFEKKQGRVYPPAH